MNQVKDQYEAYPYPERDPKDEAKRLVSGSPSHPLEIDHFLFAGRRDWSKPLRALVAGGGTGDGLIQLAQMLVQAGKKYEITYVDLSRASRKVAEARAKARKLKNISFVTGSLLDAPEMGEFDYIDCCGVLHHLPDPAEGFRALRSGLAPGGGLGFMVYAPYGRSGVYPLQEAFAALYGGLPPKARLKAGAWCRRSTARRPPVPRQPQSGRSSRQRCGVLRPVAAFPGPGLYRDRTHRDHGRDRVGAERLHHAGALRSGTDHRRARSSGSGAGHGGGGKAARHDQDPCGAMRCLRAKGALRPPGRTARWCRT